ncbi:hypothetical protein OHA98_42350 [Streptomyces sp. NBC_00654]|uniref:hypothetical protein n=1 Tax=Streptomyces sp. NBC_00654 TaxID=2975799 RepID=UPI0022589CCE|nr:hypothetical protein [Streptomyces sp. NBC_00654]MCX4971243.1 hypothetical protein [Streptomyces sp. NBC_00654]
MSDTHEPGPEVPPLHTIPDAQRVPRPRRPAPPRLPQPVNTLDDLPPGAIVGIVLVGILALVAAVNWVIPDTIGWSRNQDWTWATQWADTITDPVRTYLGAHTAGLPITATTLYVIWQAVGLGSLIGAWISTGVGPRLTWIAHGTATAAMVWDASPTAGRTIATGLAVIAWTICSTLAMRGISLRPVVHLHRS